MTEVHALGQLGENVPMVQLQLRKAASDLPEEAWKNAEWIGDKSIAPGSFVGSQQTGVRFIAEGDRDTSLEGFTLGLAAAGYTLVHVGKRRANTDKGTQHVLRYTFGRIPHEKEEMRTLGDRLSGELERYLGEALFNVQAFRNPLYQNDKEVPGKSVITIDVNSRKPLFQMKDGKREPVLVWAERDEEGKGVGEQVALAPKHFLDVSDDDEVAIFTEPREEETVAQAS